MKRCATGDHYRPESEFSKNSNSSDGLSYTCTTCSKAKSLAYRLRQKGPAERSYKRPACRCHPTADGHRWSDDDLTCHCGQTWHQQQAEPVACSAGVR